MDTHSQAPDEAEHPRGTIAILLIYGALFLLGWLALYFGVFIPRGPIGG